MNIESMEFQIYGDSCHVFVMPGVIREREAGPFRDLDMRFNDYDPDYTA